MKYIQQYFNKYFLGEIYHSIGSYSFADNLFADLFKGDEPGAKSVGKPLFETFLPEGIRTAIKSYNNQLRNNLCSAKPEKRHPVPDLFFYPFSDANLQEQSDSSYYKLPDQNGCKHIFNYYNLLKHILREDNFKIEDKEIQQRIPEINACFCRHSDSLFDSSTPTATNIAQTKEQKLSRLDSRLSELKEIIDCKKENQDKFEFKEAFKSIVFNNFKKIRGNDTPFNAFIIQLFNYVHFRMHFVEHKAGGFFEDLSKDYAKIKRENHALLRFCISANTFIYSSTRLVPWIFAEDETERDDVISLCSQGNLHYGPRRCIWLSFQISMLSLYRRAFCYGLAGKNDKAFNDYYKLQGLIRNIKRILIKESVTYIQSSDFFLKVLDALCEYRIGELYRSNHAHEKAFDHYCLAYERLEMLINTEGYKPVLYESRFRIELMMSKGKAFFELGQIKRSLQWYLKAWDSFLDLLSMDNEFGINKRPIISLINWLREHRYDPEIHKNDLSRLVIPFIKSLKTTQVPDHLKGFAADILNRFSHNLYILNLNAISDSMSQSTGTRHELAFECIRIAQRLDPNNLLIQKNVLQINQSCSESRIENGNQYSSDRPDLSDCKEEPLAQRLSGSTDFERFSRLYEYHLLKVIEKNSNSEKNHTNSDEELSKWLLAQFLTDTDSGSGKLSQIYQLLMRQPRPGIQLDPISDLPFLELVVLQRYSSFYPFLPRPSAIKGGGYLIRVHGSLNPNVTNQNQENIPFGIAIDPGADFIENLYRSGFSLADLDLIIVTHDHADHIASLDPILTLLDYRLKIGKFKKRRILKILCNAGVYQKYSYYEEISNGAIKISQLNEGTTEIPLWMNEIKEFYHETFQSIEITAIETNHKDSRKKECMGVAITLPTNRVTIANTSDIRLSSKITKNKSWHKFLTADVLISHLSAAPISELLQIGKVSFSKDTKSSEQKLLTFWDSLNPDDFKDLKGQIEFAYWLSGRKKNGNNKPTKSITLKPFESIPAGFFLSGSHLYCKGMIELAKAFRDADQNKKKLFLISEFREELGSFRTKIATAINSYIFKDRPELTAMTSDIGLNIIVKKDRMSALCSHCKIDNDCSINEQYHPPQKIKEVCIKGEEEGIFYNCDRHDPGSAQSPMYAERLEHYDIFGKKNF